MFIIVVIYNYGSIAPFPSTVDIVITAYNGKVLAQPSSLTSDGSSFTVTYISSGK